MRVRRCHSVGKADTKEYLLLPKAQADIDRRCIFGITIEYMARYKNQDFHQNVSFKCSMEFRYALKLTMEKSGSRDLSSFIRQHLEPAIQQMLDPLEREQLADLGSPVKLKEAARRYYRNQGCRRMVNAVRLMLGAPLPSLDRRKLEIARVVDQYETDAKAAEDDRNQPTLLRAALASVITTLGKIAKILEKPWAEQSYSNALKLAAELPEDLSLDVSHGLDFLSDDNPSMDKAYAMPPKLDPESAWLHVRQSFAADRPLLANVITQLSLGRYDGTTLTILFPDHLAEKINKLKTPANSENLSIIAESCFGARLEIKFEPLPPSE